MLESRRTRVTDFLQRGAARRPLGKRRMMKRMGPSVVGNPTAAIHAAQGWPGVGPVSRA